MKTMQDGSPFLKNCQKNIKGIFESAFSAVLDIFLAE